MWQNECRYSNIYTRFIWRLLLYDKLVERKLNFVNDDTQKDLTSGQNMPQDPQDTQQSPDTGGDGAANANAFSSDGGQSGSGDSGPHLDLSWTW